MFRQPLKVSSKFLLQQVRRSSGGKVNNGEKGKSFWTRSSGLELFRIIFYLSVPVLAGVVYSNPSLMNDLIMTFKLVEYPEAAPPLPVGEEINKYRAKIVADFKKAQEEAKNQAKEEQK